MKLRGKLIEAIPLLGNRTRYVIECAGMPEEIDDILAQDLDVELKKHREKRSLDANAYCWALIHKLAEVTRIPAIEIYREAVRNIGGNNEIVCVQDKAVEKLVEGWQRNGIGWITSTMPSKIEGCTNVILYYGSSTYDTKQMSRLIDNIVQDCQAQGIETDTPEQIAERLSLWSQSYGK